MCTSFNEAEINPQKNNKINTSSGSAATRIAYYLNLKGLAFSLNSTCSGSLTELKIAWNSIQCGDCDMAIVGAASLRLPQSCYIVQPGLIFLAKRICCPFDHNSDGTITENSCRWTIKCDKKAIQSANLIPANISFIEAHGTATKLGNPIKIKDLTKVFNELSSTTKKHCAISFEKSNIGNCNIAAGFAGLIKTVKAIEDYVIPP
ncbi:polyketide synthase [Gigaspora margarita]|uniref:Polyketide synthase n=1 Tax=Gigaspora margarita TaxID=4874 RepID=A0A8H4ELK4_GIGMA|nr:polyketide synthase [Gigaspora margarita]